MKKCKRNYENDTKINCYYLVVALLLSNLLLSTCSALIIKLPLKQLTLTPDDLARINSRWNGKGSAGNPARSERAANPDLSAMVDNMMGESGKGYYTNIYVGTPPQKMQVLIDTGSSNFAIACTDGYNLTTFFRRLNSTTYEEHGVKIFVPYTAGSWSGMLGSDMVALTSAKSLSSRVHIACITEASDFFPQKPLWQGILGMAYSGLSRPDSSVIPFWDSVTDSHPDMSDIFSIQLCGSSFVRTHEVAVKKGTLILGGIIPKLSTSPILYTPIYKKWYYEVILTDIKVKYDSLGLDCKEYNLDKTIVDTGTTSIRLPDKVFAEIQLRIVANLQRHRNVLIPHQGFFDGDDLICYYSLDAAFIAFPVVSFYMYRTENTVFRLDLSPQHYLRPVPNYHDPVLNHTCVKYGFARSESGTVLGAIFMEAFYVVFDRVHNRIGFGQTSCELPDPNNKILDVTVHGPYTVHKNISNCGFEKPEAGSTKFLTISYILLAFCLIIFVPLILLVFLKIRKAFCAGTMVQDDEQTVLSLSSGGQ